MAEDLGRRARWTSMLVAVPGAAALLGAATSWAVHAEPSKATPTPAPTAARTQRTADAAVLAAQHSAAANRQELSRLERQLARLRAQVAALGTSSPTTPRGASTTGARNTPSTGPTARTAQQLPTASAAPSAPAPPRTTSDPPPVQTSTGASGAAG